MRRRTSDIVDLVDLDVERERHVVAHQLEVLVADVVRIVALGPVKKLSKQTRSAPRAVRRSHRCEPRKPAPPVTRMRFSTDPDRPTEVAREGGRRMLAQVPIAEADPFDLHAAF
jgi:hypothetical protein